MRTLFFVLVFIFCNLSQASEGIKIDFPVIKYELPNGLIVLLYQDSSVPIVSYQTWFKVGSKDEETGSTGMAHLLEHLAFKGTARYSEEDFEKILQKNGITNNAFTTSDYTGYYENLPSDKLELIADIESDRMQNLSLKEETFKSELEVVKEERRFRTDNNPNGELRELLFKTVYRVHPYRWPVIGSMEDLNNLTVKKVQDFWQTWYAPNNAILVIAGDINVDKTQKLIEKYYGKIPRKNLPEKKYLQEPTQKSAKYGELKRNVQTPTIAIAFPSVASGTEESYALDLLASILGDGNSSRLYKRLVYQGQQASSAYAYHYTPQHAGIFQIGINLKPDANVSKIIDTAFAEIWRLRKVLVSETELQKAKNQVMKSYVDSLMTIHGKAHALALNEVLFGSYKELFKDLGRYQKVTTKDILTVAEKFLIPDHRTTIKLLPKAQGSAQ